MFIFIKLITIALAVIILGSANWKINVFDYFSTNVFLKKKFLSNYVFKLNMDLILCRSHQQKSTFLSFNFIK